MKSLGVPLISAVILCHNGADYLINCLKSVLCNDYPNFEVIIVDNASTDGSCEIIKSQFSSDLRVKTLPLSENIGMTARNLGAKLARGEYLLFLDVDTVIDKKCLSEINNAFTKYQQVGVIQCKLLRMADPKLLDNAGHYIDRFGITYFIGFMEPDSEKYSSPYTMFGAAGAAFAIRRDLFFEVGGINPYFFNYFDESDLCWRVWLHGFKVMFCPSAVCFHRSGHSYRDRTGKIPQHLLELNSFLFTKNRLSSMIINYSVKNVIKYVPINITLMLGLSLLKIKNKQPRIAGALIGALLWNLINLAKLLSMRKMIQARRKVTDKFLMDGGIIKRPNFYIIYRKLKSIV